MFVINSFCCQVFPVLVRDAKHGFSEGKRRKSHGFNFSGKTINMRYLVLDRVGQPFNQKLSHYWQSTFLLFISPSINQAKKIFCFPGQKGNFTVRVHDKPYIYLKLYTSINNKMFDNENIRA